MRTCMLAESMLAIGRARHVATVSSNLTTLCYIPHEGSKVCLLVSFPLLVKPGPESQLWRAW